ncbi:carboxypeptidase-like regulatory domain-containing protein [Plebeiibacterium marinum]|uniref:Carboxypeptidase-like regulatory domain-containing protein n=1 Tax=Plebeiibacterium marinum TaxID=2992111 RepID=A0AAE3MBX8_9BACT|nr:carboxypeptidase-like regulatory domain-containing protein [Plebeiobacterium marinum]MCW3805068.1 carboxypeptidase-like regulatory domain-containing protein [Plebeiobacterium marinum]
MPYNNQNISSIRKYLRNELSERERYAFERKMEADPFLHDAVEGYKNLNNEELKDTIKLLHNKFEQRKKTKAIPTWMQLAATIVFIIGISTLIFISNNNQQPKLSKAQKTEPIVDSAITSKGKTSISKEPSTKATILPEKTVSNSEPEILTSIDDDISLSLELSHLPEAQKNKSIEKANNQQFTINQKELVLSEEEELDFIIENEKPVLTGQIKGDKLNGTTPPSSADHIFIRGRSIIAPDSFVQYNGKVVDNEGLPLPGVTIIEAGKSNGTITDMDGNFTIEAPQSGSLLTFDFIGFKQKSVIVTKDSIGEVKLEADALAMDEIVAVGYGTERKSKRSGNQKETKADIPNTTYAQVEPLIGLKKFKRKIQRNLKLPSDAISNEITVKITIDSSGDISDIITLTPVNSTFAKELKEAITELGKWQCIRTDNSPASCSRVIVFEF